MILEVIGSKRTTYSAHGSYQPEADPELSACPFCGSENIEVMNTHTPYYTATCADCGVEGPTGEPNRYDGNQIRSRAKLLRVHQEAFDAAVRGWNQRA